MARNLYLTGLEELEGCLCSLDAEKGTLTKRTITQLLHRDETNSPPFRRFGARSIDSNRRALRLAVRGELGTDDETIKEILEALFDEPSPQQELLTTVLERYRRYVEEAVGSDSDSD